MFKAVKLRGAPWALDLFLQLGGHLEDGIASWGIHSFPVPASDLYCLYPAAVFMQQGASISFEADEYVVEVPAGPSLALPKAGLTSGLWLLYELLVERDYDALQVQNAVVVDIGANIGDTAVYFASRGAYKVLAYEPFQAAAALAVRNIKRNCVEDRVHLVCAGAASRSCRSIVSYDSRVPSTSMRALPDDAVGAPEAGRWTRQEEVLLLSFADILQDAAKFAQGRHIVVKVDCEGAEFDILLTEPLPDSFGEVSQVLIETHDRQPDPIIKLLAEAGFTVEVTRKEIRRLAYLVKAKRSVSPSQLDWKNSPLL